MSAGKYLAGVFVIVCFVYASAEPLTCVSCRSDADDEWADLCVAADLNVTADFPTVECGGDAAAAEGNDTAEDKSAPKCYKTIISMYDAVTKKEYELVSRGCEVSAMTGCDKSLAPSGGDYVSCYCDTEKCNSAHVTTVATSALCLGMFAAAARYFF